MTSKNYFKCFFLNVSFSKMFKKKKYIYMHIQQTKIQVLNVVFSGVLDLENFEITFRAIFGSLEQ